MTSTDSIDEQRKLAQLAARGEPAARRRVNEMVHPVIDYLSNRYCPRFCDQNRFLYQCTLSKPVSRAPPDALLCEWGNASYGWMLNDLSSPARLRKYEGKNRAGLFDYLYQIANSLPFYERWKDWRFDRKVHVPTYIQALGPLAKRVFYALRAGADLEMLAVELSASLDQIETLTHRIVSSLARRNRLYLLDPPRLRSLTANAETEASSAGEQQDVAVIDETVLQQDEFFHLNQAWQQLDTVEQFVLEALIVNEQSAQSVLHALQAMGIEIKPGIAPEQTSNQQLYYFKRKALARLAQLLKSAGVEG